MSLENENKHLKQKEESYHTSLYAAHWHDKGWRGLAHTRRRKTHVVCAPLAARVRVGDG